MSGLKIQVLLWLSGCDCKSLGIYDESLTIRVTQYRARIRQLVYDFAYCLGESQYTCVVGGHFEAWCVNRTEFGHWRDWSKAIESVTN
jgi:hypothetical protein